MPCSTGLWHAPSLTSIRHNTAMSGTVIKKYTVARLREKRPVWWACVGAEGVGHG